MEKHAIQQIKCLIEDPAFRAWCIGEVSTDEARYWEHWTACNASQRQAANVARQIVLELAHSQKSLSPDQKFEAWQTLSEQLVANRPNHLFQGYTPRGHRSNVGWLSTAVAASLLVVILLVTARFTNLLLPADQKPVTIIPTVKTIATDYGQQKIVRLESGTKITLNANSSITYRSGWVYNDEVRVKLEGEAYFDVAERSVESEPVFRVETTDGDISVLGTRFMVSTWNKKTRVVLEEGRVSLQKKSGREVRRDTLEPHYLAEFSQLSDDISIGRVDTKLYTSWTKGFFSFDHTPLVSVADRINQTFGVNVEIVDPTLFTREISGAIENSDLEVVISALAKAMEIPISRYGNNVVIGNFLFESPSHNQSANLTQQR